MWQSPPIKSLLPSRFLKRQISRFWHPEFGWWKYVPLNFSANDHLYPEDEEGGRAEVLRTATSLILCTVVLLCLSSNSEFRYLKKKTLFYDSLSYSTAFTISLMHPEDGMLIIAALVDVTCQKH